MYFTLITLTPTEEAACEFSPTERIFNPRGVWYNNTHVKNTQMNAKYVNKLCPDNTCPITGILSMSGIVILGICNFCVIKEVVEVSCVPCVIPVITFTRKIVPPDPIILTAVPVKIMFVFKLNAKNPITKLTIIPTAIATSKPTNQLPE